MVRRTAAVLCLGCTYWVWGGLGASADDAPFIQGRVALKSRDKGQLSAGYVGVNSRDMLQSNVAGLSFKPGDTGWRVQAETFKGRISWLTSEKKDEIQFRHLKLEPGRYLVYARWGDRFLDWRWLEVKGDSELTVDFTLEPAKAGRVEVNAKPTEFVRLIPLDGDGKMPLQAKVHANVAVALGTSIKTAGPSPVIDGLRPGRYRVIAGAATADVEIKAGETVSVSPK